MPDLIKPEENQFVILPDMSDVVKDLVEKSHPAVVKKAMDTMRPHYEAVISAALEAREIIVNNELDVSAMKAAKELKKRIVSNRTAANKAKGEGKEIILASGKVWDALYNKLEEASKKYEAVLDAQANYAENKIKKAAQELHDSRLQELAEEGLKDFIIGEHNFGLLKPEEWELFKVQTNAAKSYKEQLAKEQEEQAAREAKLQARRVEMARYEKYISPDAINYDDNAYAAAIATAQMQADADAHELEILRNKQGTAQKPETPKYVVRLEGKGEAIESITIRAYTGQMLELVVLAGERNENEWVSEHMVSDGEKFSINTK